MHSTRNSKVPVKDLQVGDIIQIPADRHNINVGSTHIAVVLESMRGSGTDRQYIVFQIAPRQYTKNHNLLTLRMEKMGTGNPFGLDSNKDWDIVLRRMTKTQSAIVNSKAQTVTRLGSVNGTNMAQRLADAIIKYMPERLSAEGEGPQTRLTSGVWGSDIGIDISSKNDDGCDDDAMIRKEYQPKHTPPKVRQRKGVGTTGASEKAVRPDLPLEFAQEVTGLSQETIRALTQPSAPPRAPGQRGRTPKPPRAIVTLREAKTLSEQETELSRYFAAASAEPSDISLEEAYTKGYLTDPFLIENLRTPKKDAPPITTLKEAEALARYNPNGLMQYQFIGAARKDVIAEQILEATRAHALAEQGSASTTNIEDVKIEIKTAWATFMERILKRSIPIVTASNNSRPAIEGPYAVMR